MEPASRLPSFPLSAGRVDRLEAALREGWRSGLEAGLALYDPGVAERFEAPPFRFHFLPGRAARPGAGRPSEAPPEGVRLPHSPCPFDGADFVAEREVARLERAGRVYHLTANRYPVSPTHFLGVRSAAEPPETLPQALHGAPEIEDMLLVAAMLGGPFRVYFNSNRGADNSQSGSSVNHWHFQLIEYPRAWTCWLALCGLRLRGAASRILLGYVPDWPARHVAVEGPVEEIAIAAAVLWGHVAELNLRNSAYNVEFWTVETGRFRAYLFPRLPGPDLAVPGAGHLSANFGGWELSGDIVVPTREIFDWIRASPSTAVELTRGRLRDTTSRPAV